MSGFDWNAFPEAKAAEGFKWDDYPEVATTPADQKVYDQPVGPEQALATDRFAERVRDPARWQAVLDNSGPYANKNLVQGDVPAVAPAFALPQVAAVMGRASRSFPGRVATGALQGAVTAPEGKRTEGALIGGAISGGSEVISGVSKLAGKTPEVVKDAVKRAIGAAIGYRSGGSEGALVGGVMGPAAAKLTQKAPAAAVFAGRDPMLRQKVMDAIRALKGEK